MERVAPTRLGSAISSPRPVRRTRRSTGTSPAKTISSWRSWNAAWRSSCPTSAPDGQGSQAGGQDGPLDRGHARQVADPDLISMSRAAAGQMSAGTNWRAVDQEMMRPLRDLLIEPVAALGSSDVERDVEAVFCCTAATMRRYMGSTDRPDPRHRTRGAVLPARTGGQVMRAVVCRSYGPPETWLSTMFPSRSGSRPAAGPGPRGGGELSRRAVHRRQVPVKIPPPFIPGNEIAGEVIAAGDGAPLARDSGFRNHLRRVRRTGAARREPGDARCPTTPISRRPRHSASPTAPRIMRCARLPSGRR